jgi:hypothetical protein
LQVNSTSVNVTDKNLVLASNTTDSTLFNGGGLELGTGANQATLLYDDALKAWSSNLNFNAQTGFDYLIAGGSANIGGATLSASQLAFNSANAALTLGSGVTLDKSQLLFTDPTSVIRFGTVSQIGEYGFSSTSDSATLTLGANSKFKIAVKLLKCEFILTLNFV